MPFAVYPLNPIEPGTELSGIPGEVQHCQASSPAQSHTFDRRPDYRAIIEMGLVSIRRKNGVGAFLLRAHGAVQAAADGH